MSVAEERQEGMQEQDDQESAAQENIFLFVPNVIGYVRVILPAGSLYFMPLHPRRCSFLYSVSCLLDAMDGYAARRFKQSTRFGMVIDRCATTCLLVFLALAKPAAAPIFQALISLDFASHYMHMYATLALGTGESHKDVSAKKSRLLNIYYNRYVLFASCAFNELFFIGLYLLCFSSPTIDLPLLPGSFESMRAAEPPEIYPRFSAAAMEIARANKLSDKIPKMIVLASAPGMLFKQSMNVLQLVSAGKWLAQGDRDQRRKLKLAKEA